MVQNQERFMDKIKWKNPFKMECHDSDQYFQRFLVSILSDITQNEFTAKDFFSFVYEVSIPGSNQRSIQSFVKHLSWSGYKPLTIFAKRCILDVWQSSEYAYGNLVWGASLRRETSVRNEICLHGELTKSAFRAQSNIYYWGFFRR